MGTIYNSTKSLSFVQNHRYGEEYAYHMAQPLTKILVTSRVMFL